MATPQFRAETIGSLLRPAGLADLRRRHVAGEVSDESMKAAEDAAIRSAIQLQKDAGLRVVTDGEYRRASYHSFFYRQLGDVDIAVPPEATAAGGPTRATQPAWKVRSRLRWTHPIHLTDFEFLRTLTEATPKITVPGPCTLHFRGGDAAVLGSSYRDMETFWSDIVDAYRKEFDALAAAGCSYVQIDETAFAKFGDPEVQATLAARGEDWNDTIDRYIEVTNRALANVPSSLRLGMHLCRGNRGGKFHAAGSYDAVADKLFNSLKIDLFFLEYDSARAGDYAPLRFLPRHKSVVLGLVSTKTPVLENKVELTQRIESATKYVDLDRLALSPQCGFASSDMGNPISPQIQEAKLRMVVDVAKDVWGTA